VKLALHTKGPLHPWLHFALFSVLGLLAIWGSPKAGVRGALLLGAVLLGLSIEFSEAVRFKADFEGFDVLTDTAGVLAGAVLGYLVTWRKR
jgi:hypothetical protein